MDPDARLSADRRETDGRLALLRADVAGIMAASRDTNADDEHDPEGQTIAYERARALSLVRRTELHLVEVDAALARLRDGSYGVCERCGEGVGEGRLEARPTARRCLGCARLE